MLCLKNVQINWNLGNTPFLRCINRFSPSVGKIQDLMKKQAFSAHPTQLLLLAISGSAVANIFCYVGRITGIFLNLFCAKPSSLFFVPWYPYLSQLVYEVFYCEFFVLNETLKADSNIFVHYCNSLILLLILNVYFALNKV